MNEKTMKPYVIGLDLGGTNSVFGIVDVRGDIKATTAIKTTGFRNAEDYVKAAVETLKVIIKDVGGIETIRSMGIGAPNGNYYKGTIEYAPNLPWAHNVVVPLADMFSEALGIPVALTNDANAAAIGEMTYGIARGLKNFIMITDLPVNWAISSCDPRTGAFAAVGEWGVWKPTALQREWPVQLVNFCLLPNGPLCCVT